MAGVVGRAVCSHADGTCAVAPLVQAAGAVVGIVGGLLTKDTAAADMVAVVSAQAAVAGSMPGPAEDLAGFAMSGTRPLETRAAGVIGPSCLLSRRRDRHPCRFESVAYVGRVPVAVRGRWRAGWHDLAVGEPVTKLPTSV